MMYKLELQPHIVSACCFFSYNVLLFKRFTYFYFISMGFLPVHHVYEIVMEVRRAPDPLEMELCGLSCGCWELNLAPLGEQPVL